MPEWRGKKKTDVRPCVVRKAGTEKSWIIPVSSKHQDNSNSVYLEGLARPSFAVMPAESRKVIDNSELHFLDVVPEETEKDIYIWELRNEVFNLEPDEYKKAVSMVAG